ncbi:MULTISPECIES: hypothetical protein [Vibrio]|uniref:hypothetical protein n=1 Tax=Vibrio TaxID=662 RepID=UPI000305738F|nr:hypothetical protein [Vibrio tasmaniensis]OEF83996.1 hypothetical protein A162_11365 [Vibrio tasmaniensis 1F-155]PMO75793.1 hypothetical protein BCT01_16950 [Vibrio tasmaniensis]
MLEKNKGLIVGIVVITYLIIMITLHRYPDMSFADLASIFAMLTSTAAVAFTVLSASNQKKQWLNDSFLKYEAEQLLTFRKMLVEAEQSINFFLNTYLRPDMKYGETSPKQDPQIKYLELSNHFNQLVELNDYYNMNQHIFRKHGLERKLECVALLLESARYVPRRDIKYQFIGQEKAIWTYRVETEVLEKIFNFNFLAHSHFDVSPNKPESIDEMNAYLKKDRFEELERLRDLTGQSLFSLVFDINKLTTFSDNVLSPSFNSNRKRFFAKKNNNDS